MRKKTDSVQTNIYTPSDTAVLLYSGLVAHTSYDNDDDKYPKDHIKIEVAAAASAAVSLTAFSHSELLLSMFCNIYYDFTYFFAFCPNVLLEFFIKIG